MDGCTQYIYTSNSCKCCSFYFGGVRRDTNKPVTTVWIDIVRCGHQTKHTHKKNIYIYIYKKKIYEIQRHNTEEVTRPFRGDSLKKAFRFVIFFFVFVFVSKNKIKRGKYEMTWQKFKRKKRGCQTTKEMTRRNNLLSFFSSEFFFGETNNCQKISLESLKKKKKKKRERAGYGYKKRNNLICIDTHMNNVGEQMIKYRQPF